MPRDKANQQQPKKLADIDVEVARAVFGNKAKSMTDKEVLGIIMWLKTLAEDLHSRYLAESETIAAITKES